MPAPLYQYVKHDSDKHPLVVDLSDAGGRLSALFQHRQEAHDMARKFQRDLIDAQADLERNTLDAPERIGILQRDLAEIVLGRESAAPIVTADGSPDYREEDTTGRVPRAGGLGQRVEDLIRFMAPTHFLETGRLLPPSACSFERAVGDGDDNTKTRFCATDEEYLAGAMGVAQDLSQYAMGRATARDADSVRQARDLVEQILNYLLRFDFRNGFLRRKYDGTKYALKAVETLLYELSITGATVESSSDSSANNKEEPGAKKPRIEEPQKDESSSSPAAAVASLSLEEKLEEELEGLRVRMEQRDKVRETLIKKSRDGQKAAKQAIYALHRNDFPKAAKLLKDCEDCINQKLMPLVREEPPLRRGCFANVLEEYAEAKLFSVWLQGKEDGIDEAGDVAMNDGKTDARGTLLLPSDFSNVPLELDEYLGGLCDLTGEIGRYAVRKGTNRDHKGVYQCLEANGAIFRAVRALEKPPQRIQKKMDALRQSVSKIERMIYEISLSTAAGMKFSSDLPPQDDQPSSREE